VLNKLIAVKVIAALSVAGIGTGAAAGELPAPLQDLASDAADVVDVEIPGSEVAPEVPEVEEPQLTEQERAAEKAAREAEKAAEEAAREAEKAADEAPEDDTADVEADAPKAKKSDREKSDKKKSDNHGAVVSECARTTKLHGRAKGQAIAALARGDVESCDRGEGAANTAPQSEHAGKGKAKGKAIKEARQAEKAAKQVAKEERKASKGARATNPAV
jgi:hypothetical protein